ncbi:MAG: PepSY domain-containing protein [Pseudohongiellaceae bacterium]
MKITSVVMVTAMLLATLVTPAQAQLAPQVEQNQLDRANQSQRVQPESRAGLRINERQAVALAREKFTGNVLRISLVGQGNNRRYQIRMEDEGKVFTVYVHGMSGEVTGGS